MLKDVYENEGSERLHQSPSGPIFDHKQATHGIPYFPVADRTLWEIKPEADEFAPCADDLGSGLDDNSTLKQLKKQLRKKRKHIAIDENLQQDIANEKAALDESDLNEPLINWKPKRSKTLKAKRKHLKPCDISSSTIDITVKSEVNLVFESPQVGGPALVTRVKVEVPDAEQLECQNKISYGDASSNDHSRVPDPGKMVLNECNREPMLCVNTCKNFVNNEISYYHVEDVEPISMIVGTRVELETPETACGEILDAPSVEIEKQKETLDSHSWREPLSEDQNPDCMYSRSSSSVEDMPEERRISGTQVPNMDFDGCMGTYQECNSVLSKDYKTQADFQYEPNDSLNSLDKNCSVNQDSVASLKTEENQISTEDTTANKEQSSTCFRNELNSEAHTENESLKSVVNQTLAFSVTTAENDTSLENTTCDISGNVTIRERHLLVDKQNSGFTMCGAENEPSLENGICDSTETILTPEAHQSPERLFSTRKAFSPSSQEQMRLVLNSDEIQNIVLECKEKLFENQYEKNKSSPRSDVQNDEETVNQRSPGQGSQQKFTRSPRCIIRKSRIAKCNLEGPRVARALPNVSTACTSVQGCSEGAVAFSQRQMHDMETLAEKLMNELKSMKEIVEQKLLFEAYRNTSVRNDAEEVKLAINKAMKVEETAKRWMSMMARDCTRFCKIMKLTPDSTNASEDTLRRERRKIMFADEAGGELCHIKFINNDVVASEHAVNL